MNNPLITWRQFSSSDLTIFRLTFFKNPIRSRCCGFYQLFLLISFTISSFSLVAQNNKTTIVSAGYSYLTNTNDFWLGASGVEASVEFLMNEEKIGLKIPLQLHFVGDLYLGTGANLKFYTNKGKWRGFIGPNFAIGRNLHRYWSDGLLEKELPYLYLLGDAGVAYKHNDWVVAIHAGTGYDFNYKEPLSNVGLSIGRKF